MSATARTTSSANVASLISAATPFRLPASGSPTPPWKSRSPRMRTSGDPQREVRHETSGHAVPASLALLHRAQAGHHPRRSRASAQILRILVTVMARERLYLFDTTLRDGAQTNGVDFTLHDKLVIAGMLDDLGIDYVEGGYPGANPTDTELFAENRDLKTTFTAFGMTRRPGRSASNDPGLASLLDATAD